MTVVACNLLGDGLRDVLDPRLRRDCVAPIAGATHGHESRR
ncbi:MAG TPA: hypothetical protein VFR64_20715 [Methylomirabilota bacterium]|nr:hypothetical protein [Methylomirabilota bacterium]